MLMLMLMLMLLCCSLAPFCQWDLSVVKEDWFESHFIGLAEHRSGQGLYTALADRDFKEVQAISSV